MSIKMPFKDMDIQMLSQKLRRLESYFEEDSSNVTDYYLDMYNTLNKRIKELQSRPSRTEQKQIVIENYTNLIRSLETYIEIWKSVGGGTTGFLIGSCIKRVKELKKLFENKG